MHFPIAVIDFDAVMTGNSRPLCDIQVFQRMAAAKQKAVVQREAKGRAAH